MAYAGYFGYFIGLSVIKPEQRWKILLIGLVSASIPHALWDTVLSMDTVPLEAACALLSYAVLAAAVLKAREISPNRSILQPSVIFGGTRARSGRSLCSRSTLRSRSGVCSGSRERSGSPRGRLGIGCGARCRARLPLR